MYTEEYEHKGFPFKDFLIKLILVIVFVLLLVWLLPKFITPTTVVKENNKSGGTKGGSSTVATETTSKIFQDNLDKMKDAAISYYTDERLPKEVGESKKMTLSQMIGEKLITPLVDKNNKAVDVEKSYVKITKSDEEYILKVNLKDSEKEDYILVHLGCYSYCKTGLCEKKTTNKEENVPVKGSKANSVVVIKKENISTSTYNTETSNYICQNVNGKFYDKSGNKVSESKYIISCQTPKCKNINGYYFGKSGNVVTKYTYEKECNSKPQPTKYTCIYHDGHYYDKNGNKVSEVKYIISCQAPKCQKVNGYYFGKNGDNVTKAEYKKQCESQEYLYEYAKTTSTSLSNWTSWSAWQKASCDTEEVNCSDSDISCLYKLQMLKRKEKIGTYQKSYARTRQVVNQTGSYTQKSCSKYNYVEINKTIYATTTTYTTINTVTSSTRSNSGNWKYNGRASYSNPPKDTNNTHYIFVGADYSYCGDTCTTLPNYYYDSYSLSGSLTTVKSTTTTPISSSTSYEASCGSYVTKTIPIYSTITVTDKDYRTEPLYGDVCYKSTKSRTVTSSGKTYKKWSTYNDKSLLDDGWTYTGNKKVKE